MAHSSNLPCDGDGICMSCKTKPSENETLTCKTCVTPWHVDCLSSRPEKLSDTIQWECPDCLPTSDGNKNLVYVKPGNDIVSKIRAIESDKTLSEAEKARRRQEVISGKAVQDGDGAEKSDRESNKCKNDVLGMLGGSFNCSFCMQLPERPVTTPCGHNFCLKCFQKWVGQGKKNCAICRSDIPAKMSSQPRINSALVIAIRMAKMSRSNVSGGAAKAYHFVHNQNRPDKAYTTDRAKKSGKANACSGKIFVTVPPDHFGPISAEHDPDRSLGVMVGECWEDRMECRQWGAHLPHVAGIAGQSEYGAQSVALSGGYVDDEDHGEWFLYTGSGGRDLSGNKRTNKDQSFDQKFEKMNEALRVSCLRGYPVRVVRSHKEKRSSYAPETGVRYDGVYRIEKCWRKQGIQGFKVCRYLFVRCDNDPAPWTSDENGDRPRPLPSIKELQGATDVTERKSAPSWDYNGDQGCWMWKKPPPASKKCVNQGIPEDGKKERVVRQRAHTMSIKERLLKEFCCLICKNVMVLPLTTPCAHNFCKSCLEATFAGQTLMKERTCQGRRTLRAQKNVMKCPSCLNDISDYLQNPQVNRELMGVIESLQQKNEDMDDQSDKSSEETGNINEKSDGVAEETGAKTSEDAEELEDKSRDESEETDEKIDEVTGEQQLCVLTSETLEDVQKDILKPLIKTDTQGTDQQTGNTGDDSSLKPDVADGGIKSSPIKPLTSDNVEIKEAEGKVKKVTKRKSSRDEEQQSPGANVGVRTRRQKTAACRGGMSIPIERAYKP